MKNPPLSLAVGVRRITHFTQLVPSQPGTIRRVGNPWMSGDLAVHFERQQSGRMEGLLHGHGAHEIGRPHDRGVGAVDLEEFGGGIDASEFEDVAEARAGPLGVADGAAAPLNAGQLRGEEGASVAGAFEGRRDGVLRELLEVGEGHLERFGRPGR